MLATMTSPRTTGPTPDGVPVIDGVVAGVKFAEAIVGMGLKTSKRGDLAYPLPKTYRGKLAGYAPDTRFADRLTARKVS